MNIELPNIELPKDAEGREIPLDVDALYDKNGKRLAIYELEYFPKLKRNKWMVRFLFDDSGVNYYPDEYFLTPPDSWEKLEEDLSKIVNHPQKIVCAYFGRERKDCYGCKLENCEGSCSHACLEDIITRIRKLRGEGDA